MLKALSKCFHHFRVNNTKVVHCHLLKANFIGLLAAKLYGTKKRIYTRHHSTFHHIYSKKGVWLDRFINGLATHIVSISPGVSRVLTERECVQPTKVHLIPHGFDFNDLNRFSPFTLNNQRPTIGVVSRFIEWKGVQYTIGAFKMVLKKFPDAQLKLYGGQGPFREEIHRCFDSIPVGSYEVIEDCSDMEMAYAEMDVYVHVPIDSSLEAFGQTYVESSAMEIPSVFTLSGIAHEFVKHEYNALVVNYQDSNEIYRSIIRLLEDRKLANKLVQQARLDVLEKFSVDAQVLQLEFLYS